MLKYPKRYTKDQRASILSEHLKEGLSISELSRKYQVSVHTIYKWRNAMREQQDEDKKISLDTDQLLSEIEQLKRENSRLKHTVAEQALDISTLKQWNDFIKKKLREEKQNSQKNSLNQKLLKSQSGGSAS